MIFQTKRLILRPWQEEDAPDLYEYARSEKVGLSCGWIPHRNVKESLEVIQQVLIPGENWAICCKENLRAVGSIGLFPHMNEKNERNEKEIEIGFWIGEPFWGRGLFRKQ